ncbi:2-C-methyl-D-erythritol 2,4-cyclodiphosphate synthase [Cryomorphaceae bacterium]|nr:2-C-methyl-D-erythritol 2,4-cyclodiphosphate synthase [Cryomorphaceae bacterium]
MTPFRIGLGYDVHRWEEGGELWLGGIRIDHTHGLKGHSDADVLIHAICDAILGAADLRDIGYHFPDTDPKYKGVDSKILLKEVMRLLRDAGWSLGNVDATMVAERPKLNPHIPDMKACMAEVMEVSQGQISLKATTSEKLGFVGREEGMAVHAVAMIIRD